MRALGLAAGLALAALPARAEVAEADALELVQILTNQTVTRHDGPLAEMQGRADLYARLHEAAAGGDDEALAAWLLLGFAAQVTVDGATSEAFIGDAKPMLDARGEAMVGQLALSPWLVPSTCYYLGRYFGWEDRHADEREPFLATSAETFAALPEAPRAACIAQIEAPERGE